MSKLADRLREAMEDNPGIRAMDLARACGIKAASIAHWQSGQTENIVGSNLLAAAELLRVNPWWLAAGKGDKHAPYSLDRTRGVVGGKPTEPTAPATDWPFSSPLADYRRLDKGDKRALDRVVSQFIAASCRKTESRR